jgi:hypothetical protein
LEGQKNTPANRGINDIRRVDKNGFQTLDLKMIKGLVIKKVIELSVLFRYWM